MTLPPAAPGPGLRLRPRQMLLLGLGAVMLLALIGGWAFYAGLAYPRGNNAKPALAVAAVFTPPAERAIPAGPDGDAIRRGRQIFIATGEHAGEHAGAHVGNGLSCGNCHLDAGRRADAAPMWGAWGNYPAYRAKNHRINTIEDRISDCFAYSMNAQASRSGGPPPRGDDLYRDLEAYFAWVSTGAPTGKAMPGRGYPKLAATALGHDPARGAQIFAGYCSSCHGADGQGQGNGAGRQVYPPLWGVRSFNWGAGMANVASAAGFIQANMPYGQGHTLTAQQAWDVAAFVDSRERPRDPRQVGSIAAARRQFHASGDYYGQTIGGDLLGDGVVRGRAASVGRDVAVRRLASVGLL